MVDIPNNARTLGDDERSALAKLAEQLYNSNPTLQAKQAYIAGFLAGYTRALNDYEDFIDEAGNVEGR